MSPPSILEPAEFTFPTVYRGADWRRSFTFRDSLDAPIDLTGRDLVMQLREPAESVGVALEISTMNSRFLVTNPAAGEALLTVPRLTVDHIPAGTWGYNIRLDGAGWSVILLRGAVTFAFGETRAANLTS